MRKKFANIFFGAIMKKKTALILINMFSPTFVPNLVTLAWKMSSGMPKEAGSLNGRIMHIFNEAEPPWSNSSEILV